MLCWYTVIYKTKTTFSLNTKKNIFSARAVKTTPQVPLAIFLTLHTKALMAMLGICPDLTARDCKQLRWTPAWRKFHLQTETSFLTLSLLRFQACLQENHYVYSQKKLWVFPGFVTGVVHSHPGVLHMGAASCSAGMLAAALGCPRCLAPRAPGSALCFQQHRDAGAVVGAQASEWKINQMNNAKLLDVTAELCNSRTALLN